MTEEQAAQLIALLQTLTVQNDAIARINSTTAFWATVTSLAVIAIFGTVTWMVVWAGVSSRDF